MTPRRRRPAYVTDERGQAGGIEAVPFGLLILIVGALLIANAWAVVDAKMAVVAAAREAARSAVEADNLSEADAAARRAAEAAVLGHRRNPDDLGRISLTADSGFRRCARIDVRVTYVVPAVVLPWIDGFGDFEVSATHSEIVDPFREGVDDTGAAQC